MLYFFIIPKLCCAISIQLYFHCCTDHGRKALVISVAIVTVEAQNACYDCSKSFICMYGCVLMDGINKAYVHHHYILMHVLLVVHVLAHYT